jgi:hypothetical protein
MRRLYELKNGDKFVIVHEDGSVSESPWFLIKTDGMYAVCAKRAEALPEEYVYILANAPIREVN